MQEKTIGAAVAAGLLAATTAVARPTDVVLETTAVDLPDGTTLHVDRGTLEVPAYRPDPDASSIRIAFARVRTTASEPSSPVIYLAGGPGGSSTGRADDVRSLAGWRSVIDVCDLIFLDQRGTGRSEPDVRVTASRVPTEIFRSRDDAMAAVRELAEHAKAELATRHVDLRGFDSEHAADDIDDLRRALGYERVSLLGFSYGTHLAQVAMRRHGVHLDGVVIAGIEGLDQTYKLPLNMDRQFERLALLAAADPGVAPHVPDLVALYDRVAARLDRAPMVVPARHPATGETIEVPVGGYGLSLILRFDIGDASDLPVFPKLLHSIDRGDPTLLSWFVSKRLGMMAELSAMTVLTDGSAGATEGRMSLIREQAARSRFGDAANFPFPAAAEAWGVQDVGDDYRMPVVSDVRTLLLSGTLDWNCPPFQAEQLRWGLSRASHICVENAGHEQILPRRDVQEAIVRFLAGEDVPSAFVQAPPLRFVPIEGGGGPGHPSLARR